MFPKLIWRSSFIHVTLDIYFLFDKHLLSTCDVPGTGRKWGHGSEQVQRDCCPNGVEDDAGVIKLPKTFAPRIEDSDKVRQK